MARRENEKMFTREIASTKVIAKVVSITDETITTKEFIIPFEADNTERVKAFLQKFRNTENEIIISVVSITVERKMYGCTVEDFLKIAKELDPETRKPLEQ